MRVAVVGAGAVGSLLGARLSSAGHEVLLVGRASHVRAVRARGLVVTGEGAGTFRLLAEETLPRKFAVESILWTVKTPDLGSSAPTVVQGSPRAVATLLPQNGLGVEAVAAAALARGGWAAPERVLVRAVNTLPATLMAPGEVRAAGQGEIVLPTPEGKNAEATRRLTDLLASAAIRLRTSPDIAREVWRKVIVNAAINPITAIHRVPNGRLLEEPWRSEAARLLGEAREAAGLAGFVFPAAELEAELDRVVRATAENRSSMLQDIDRGRPTEIDAISGEILRVGERAGVDLPATRAVIVELAGRGRTGSTAAEGQRS